jgi:hypothetical protein
MGKAGHQKAKKAMLHLMGIDEHGDSLPQRTFVHTTAFSYLSQIPHVLQSVTG